MTLIVRCPILSNIAIISLTWTSKEQRWFSLYGVCSFSKERTVREWGGWERVLLRKPRVLVTGRICAGLKKWILLKRSALQSSTCRGLSGSDMRTVLGTSLIAEWVIIKSPTSGWITPMSSFLFFKIFVLLMHKAILFCRLIPMVHFSIICKQVKNSVGKKIITNEPQRLRVKRQSALKGSETIPFRS